MRQLVLLLLLFGTVAHADDATDARAFFDELVRQSNNFNAGIADFYSPKARIITLRDGNKKMEMTGAQWRELVNRAMPMAQLRGDISTYNNIEVSPLGAGFRITAIRMPATTCVPDTGYYMVIEPSDDGWQVVEESTETVSLSQCEPSKALAESLAAMQAAIVPHLPLDLDADTRLERVEVVGPALIYYQRLPTIAAEDMDLQKLGNVMRQIGLQNACASKEVKALIDAGATVRYATVDRTGVDLANVDISPGLCSLLPQ